MSKRTSLSLSNSYAAQELGLTNRCPKRTCKGLLTEVWVRYKDHGPIRKELECSSCGKVVKKFKKGKRPYVHR